MLQRNLHIMRLLGRNEIKTIRLGCAVRYDGFLYACSTSMSTTIEHETKSKFFASKNTVDTFGTLGETEKDHNKPSIDQADVHEENYLANPSLRSNKLPTTKYADIIKQYIRKRQIKEAIDVLEIRMIKEDHVKPENYIYNLVLGACGRVGYTKKAFQLFNQMKKRGLKTTGGTYTALFNACANSPWSEDGLARATKLRELMTEKGINPNDTNYNAMIKAFGRTGDTKTAFELADEMTANNISIKEDTINFLLQSCINDKESGYLHALLVWSKFRQNYIKPNIFSFNLMLRCIRECDLGNPGIAENMLKGLELKSIEAKNSLKDIKSVNKIPEQSLSNNIKNKKHISLLENVSNHPNLMAKNPYLGHLIKLQDAKTAEQRLLLVGGQSGFLSNMKLHRICPTIKTFSIMLDNIPSTLIAEKALLAAMKSEGVKPDIDFMNMLIKKRSLRFDYESAKDVLDLMNTFKLRPNIFTYGVLALVCETKEESIALLNQMKDSGYRVNVEILGALVKQACSKSNFVYVLEIMEILLREKINPNKIFFKHLETFHKKCIEQAKNEEKQKGPFWTKGFHLFRMRYSSWLKEVQADPTENLHPWEQYRKPVETKVKNYKDKEDHFKPRIASRYKQKTGTIK